MYRIKRRNEETECQWCGMPLFIGDTVHEGPDPDSGLAFCGSGCAREWDTESNAPEQR